MKTPQEHIEEAVKKLWSKFKSPLGYSSIDNKFCSMYYSESFLKKELTSLHRTILQSEIEELEGLIIPENGGWNSVEKYEADVYNGVLDELIEHKKKLLEDVN